MLRRMTILDNYHNKLLKSYYPILVQLFQDDNTQFYTNIESFKKLMVEYLCVDSFIGCTRRIWFPPTSLGSQNTDWLMYKKFSTALTKIITEKRRNDMDR